MSIPAAPRWTLLAAAIVASGCSSSPEPDADSTGAASSARAPAVAAGTAASPWYARTRALDLTGDGRPDSVRLEAYGDDPDSLDVVLTLVVDGRVVHREEWGSGYELALLDSPQRAGSDVGAILRAKLDTVAASVEVERIDRPDEQLMLEDGAALDSMEAPPTHLVSFSYGYETTTRLAWDAARRRFVRLWSCC